MMMSKCLILAATGAMLVFAGCGKGQAGRQPSEGKTDGEKRAASGSKATNEVKTIGQMVPEDVIVSVNGIALTRQQYDDGVKKILQNFSRKGKVSQRQIAGFARMAMRQYVQRFVNSQLLAQEARNKGILSEEELKRKTNAALEQSAKQAGKTAGSFLPAALDKAKALRSETEEKVLVEELINRAVMPKVNVTDEYVKMAIDAVRVANMPIATSNAVKVSKLQEIRQAVKTGSDFGKLADEYSESKDSAAGKGGFWGEFERNQIEDRKIRAVVFALKTGEISEVLEDEEGYQLIKVLNRQAEKKNEKGAVVEAEAVSLARIFFYKEPELEMPGEAEVKSQLAKGIRDKYLKDLIEELKKRAVILYPHGTNFWEETKPLASVTKRGKGGQLKKKERGER